MQLLGWLRPAFPTKANHDTRGRNNGRRHKLAAPPAGSGASGPGADQSPASNGSGAGAGDGSTDSTAEHEKGLKTFPGALGVAAILSSARHWGFLWKAAAVHSANIASGLGVKTLQPLHEYLQRELESTAAVQDACRQLQVEGLSGLQDLLNCIILSEHVYKIVDHSTETSVGLINDVKALFPPQLVTLQTVCWAQPHVRHRYLLGESPDAIYVSFMGTKLPRDMATNANLFQEEVVLDAAMLTGGASGHVLDSGAAAGTASRAQLAAHRGFLTRARGVPIDSLYREARARGKRLVLCGHSLGGAVASLCALQLLQHLPPNLHHTVSCYGFATPALGNEALAETVKECGWEARIRNYLSPDDPIPKLLSFRRPPPTNTPADQPAPAVESAAPGDEPALASTSPIKLSPAAAAIQTQRVEEQARPQGNPRVPGFVAASSDGIKPAQQIEQSSNAVAARGLVGTPKRSSSTSSLPLTIASSSNDSSLPVTSTTSTSSSSSSSSTLLLSSKKHSKGSGSPVASTSSSTPPSTTRSSLPITSSSSAPALPTPASTAPPAAIVQGPTQQQHSVGSQLRNTGRLARAGVAAATSAAVAAAVLGQDLDVAAATSAAVAAAMLRQESAPAQMQGSGGRAQAGSEDEAVDGGSLKPDRQFWLGQRLAAAAAPPLRAAAAAQRASSAALAAAAPPVRAVVERAGSAARLVAVPLSAAASVPMRAAPQYLPLGQQLYISPAAVGTAEPPATIFEELPEPAAPSAPALPIATAQQKHQQPAALQPPQQPPQQQRVWPFWGPAPAAATAAVAAAATGSRQSAAQASGVGSALEDDDNVDVAAAAAMSDPEALVAAAAAAESEGPRSGGGGSTSGKKRRRAALFEAHRMATYRNRLLGICHGSLQGRLLMRSLPMLPNLPRPGDVAASELLAPAMFPLRAVGTVNQPLTTLSPVPASGAAAVSASAKPSAKPAAKAAAAKATAAKSAAAKAEKLEKLQARAARRPFWQQLLARAAGQEQQDPPVELLIRVEGKGLANVSQAWIDGVSQPATATAAGKPLAPEAAAKPAMAEVTILQQPQAPLLPPLERPPLPLVSHLLAFVSGLAVTLGWVALLRQLQPAGSGDFLLARVRLPASAVRDAQRAAQNSLLTSVTDGPLLHGLHLGPRLSLRLQSDFAVHSLPLDIRVAADMQQQLSARRWPWQQHFHAPTPASQPQQPGVQQQQQQEQRAARWWEWPGSSTAAGH